MVNDVSDVRCNQHALTVERVLYTLEQFNHFADCQYTRLGHGLPLLRVQVDGCPHQVAEVVGEQKTL